MDFAIETNHLTKKYGSRMACKDIDLLVPKGQVFALLGPNGAGKSTIVKSLTGLVKPTSGTVNILEKPLGHLATKARVGFLPELFRYYGWLTAREVLEFHSSFYKMTVFERREKILGLLEEVGLSSVAHQKVNSFSKGMQQRLGLACALVGTPDLVFLDEPTSALDPIGRRQVREIITNLKSKGTTVFLNSHLLSEVETICDKVAFINKGNIVAQGDLSQLLQEKLQVEMRIGNQTPQLLSALQELGRLEVRDDSVHLQLKDESLLPTVAQTVVASGSLLYSMTPHRHSLEDLFVQLIEGRA